jgi:hypothetical protein
MQPRKLADDPDHAESLHLLGPGTEAIGDGSAISAALTSTAFTAMRTILIKLLRRYQHNIQRLL